MDVGTVETMSVRKQTADGYILRKGTLQSILPFEETTKELLPDEQIDVFLFHDRATMRLPKVVVGVYEWVEVVEVREDLGVFVDIGTKRNVLLPNDHLPAFKKVWPIVGDILYITLSHDKQGRLLAIPAKERHFNDLFAFADDVDLNEHVEGRVIRADREGTVILTDKNYRGFIHRTEREIEPRIGEWTSGRVIEVKEDGSLNISLKPMKHERIDDDADVILDYLTKHMGEMSYTDKSSPADIQSTFKMSKSAFKRALGRLMKAGKITQQNGKTSLVKK